MDRSFSENRTLALRFGNVKLGLKDRKAAHYHLELELRIMPGSKALCEYCNNGLYRGPCALDFSPGCGIRRRLGKGRLKLSPQIRQIAAVAP